MFIPTSKPWQVRLDYNDGIGHLFIDCILTHTHGSIAFSDKAIEFCGGMVEEDDDTYTIRCKYEPSIVAVAREVARFSEIPDRLLPPRNPKDEEES